MYRCTCQTMATTAAGAAVILAVCSSFALTLYTSIDCFNFSKVAWSRTWPSMQIEVWKVFKATPAENEQLKSSAHRVNERTIEQAERPTVWHNLQDCRLKTDKLSKLVPSFKEKCQTLTTLLEAVLFLNNNYQKEEAFSHTYRRWNPWKSNQGRQIMK